MGRATAVDICFTSGNDTLIARCLPICVLKEWRWREYIHCKPTKFKEEALLDVGNESRAVRVAPQFLTSPTAVTVVCGLCLALEYRATGSK